MTNLTIEKIAKTNADAPGICWSGLSLMLGL